MVFLMQHHKMDNEELFIDQHHDHELQKIGTPTRQGFGNLAGPPRTKRTMTGGSGASAGDSGHELLGCVLLDASSPSKLKAG